MGKRMARSFPLLAWLFLTTTLGYSQGLPQSATDRPIQARLALAPRPINASPRFRVQPYRLRALLPLISSDLSVYQCLVTGSVTKIRRHENCRRDGIEHRFNLLLTSSSSV